MTKNYYIIDTSSLVELNKHNPMDVYQSVWKKMEQLINRTIDGGVLGDAVSFVTS